MAKLIAATAAKTSDIAHAENVARRVVACGLHRSCELALITNVSAPEASPRKQQGLPGSINLTHARVKTFPFYANVMAAIPCPYGWYRLRALPTLPWRRSRALARCSRDIVRSWGRRATAGPPRPPASPALRARRHLPWNSPDISRYA